ncbi:MAG TPA: efflux RND transporter permease subunit [Pirellulales bacterium]|jgi:multidrug efflux pump|nr:efflux RND transporter permease subunit [Pirellulales bacterium]
MISRFFIDRPIFAAVVSIVITLIGGIALYFLPIAQYPRITPPGVSISISYPGASAQVVADTVAAPIEQQVNGVEGMLYMSSQMGNDGSYTLTVTFDIGVDLNTALVMVQNRVALAMPQLPSQVQNQGITIRKRTPDILLIVNFYADPDKPQYDDIYLSNYATIYCKDELLRVPGISDMSYQGERDYSIRAWLDPQKLASRNMTALDVAAAIQAQNADAPAGMVGQMPAPNGQLFTMPIDTLGRLSTPEQFGDIIVKAMPTALPVRATAAAPPVIGAAGSTSGTAGSASSSSSSSTSSTPTTASSTTLLPTVGSTSSTITGTTGGSSSGMTTTSGSSATTTNLGTTGGATTAGGSTTGGAATGGGGTAAGGGTTGGGAMSAGGGTTGGAGGGGTTSGGGATGPALNAAGMPITAQTPGGRPAAGIVRLRDVARLEMGAASYTQSCLFDGRPSVGLGLYQLPGTNALDVANRVRAKMKELESRFPEGIHYDIAYDTTPFIRESINDVRLTFLEAVALVGVVVLIFLQNWRSVIIPLIAVPVAIVSTFGVMAALDFSLNNISLFGLVLAIGIVVDDAIVVVENVERWLDHGFNPRDATRKAMDEVTGPIVAVALVLCAVFVPCAFVGGITGQFFRQFAVTISVSTVFSAINSLTLSPALAAILLKPRGARRDPLSWFVDSIGGWFFRAFNDVFGMVTTGYSWSIQRMMRLSGVVLVVYGLLMVLTYVVFVSAPTGFVPQQDQGRLIVSVQLPDSSSLQRTMAALHKVADIAIHTKGVAHCVGIGGLSWIAQATSPNFASMFIVLKSFDERRRTGRPDTAIMADLRREWSQQIKDAVVTVYGASPVPGLGVAGGFKAMIEDRGGRGLDSLQQQTDTLRRKLQQGVPGLIGVNTQFRSNTPQLFMDIDRKKAAALGVSLNDVNQTLDIYFGSLYVNSFNDFGRHWQVTVQAEGQFRNRIEDVNLFQVRNNLGQMVPLGTICTAHEIGGPLMVTRYNLYESAALTGNLKPGYSSGEAIAVVDKIANESLPISMRADWTELMFMQKRAGNTSIYVFGLSVMCVFLALAALYESWSLPLAVILVVPLCLLCSVAGVLYSNHDVNIFVQIGLIVLVGLACKNAILIVEFAKQMHIDEGKPVFEATEEASRLRLRPILMTSFAFIFGVIPLVIANGAGAEMRRSLGWAVFSGMLGVTLFGIFLTPVFFYVIQGLGETRLFASARAHWIGSTFAGGLLGLLLGFLLAAIHIGRTPWMPIVLGSAGVLLALTLLEMRRRIKRL